MKQAAAILFIIISAQAALYSQTDITDVQTFIDSTINKNFFSLYLDNGIQSANLDSRLNYTLKHKRINFFFKNYYSSSVTKLSENFFRDFENVKTGVGYSVNKDLTAYINYLGMLFSDDKNIQLKGASSSLFSVSSYYAKSYSNLAFNTNVNAGYKLEKQIGELNKGISLAGEFNLENLMISDFFIDGQLKLGYEDLDPRRKNLILSRLYFDKSFADNLARNEFEGFFSRIRKDFYFPADPVTQAQFGAVNNIEERTESIIRGYDRFDYYVTPKVLFYLNVNPYYRDVIKQNYYITNVPTASPSIYDTRIQELSVGGDAALQFDYDKVNFQLKASYLERDEKHFLINSERISRVFVRDKELLEESKNNHSARFKVDGNFYYNPTLTNHFELSASSSILRYDTPSETNTDDRDELNMIVYLAHRYDNLRNFQVVNSVDLNLYHTVYIYGDKSANNNWNRVLRFTSKNTFTPYEGLRTVNSFSVLANYTAYDFEDLISTVKSYSFRQVNLKDSTIFRFTKAFGMDIYAELKLYERGELNWNAFSERPLNYFEDKIINSELNYFFNKFIVISAGYRYFEQRRYNYVNGNRIFDTSIRTYGPTARFKIEMPDNSRVEINGSYDYYKYGNLQPSTVNGNLFINLYWNF